MTAKELEIKYRKFLEEAEYQNVPFLAPEHPFAEDILAWFSLLLAEQEESLDDMAVKYDGLIDALTPSIATKCSYMGEFSFTEEVPMEDDAGELTTYTRTIFVPWTTIKEIMRAIRLKGGLPE